LGVKQQFGRVHDYVVTEVWAGRKLEMMLYQRYRYTTTGADAHQDGSMTVLQNRIVYRPIFTSPIMLLVNYEGDRALNDDAAVAAGAGPWAKKQVHQDMLEWLMRWNQVLTTRARLKGGLEKTSDTYNVDKSSGTNALQSANYTKWTYGPELQFRFYPLEDVSALYVYQTTEWKWLDQSGDAAYTAWQLLPAAGVIWRLGDKLYLDGHVNVEYQHCLSGALCPTYTKLTPYLYFTMNL
jgi:hypothetical protein